MRFFTHICLLISINTVLSRVIDVQFTSPNQTVLLFDKLTRDTSIKYQIVRSVPNKCAISFTLTDNNTNVYLRYHQVLDTSSCLLELNNEISLNVDIILNKTLVLDLPTDQIDELKLNVEYIFKIFNDSNYGLINTEMKSNGIVSIVRIVYPKNDSIELKITSFNKYFQIKMFLANFYMIRLSDNVQELYEQHDTIDLGLEAFLLKSGQSILTQRLRFKIVDQNQLKIKVPSENRVDFKITERKIDTGCYVTKVTPDLEEKLFETKNLKEFYMKNFIRMKIEASDVQDDIFDLEPIAGHLAIRAGWRSKLKIYQAKFTINISIFDTKKLFKSSSTQIRVDLIDSNDIGPKFPKQEYAIDVHENQLNQFVSVSKNDQKYFLVFNQSANNFGLNSFLDYMIVYVKLNNRYSNSNFFLLEKQSGKLWLNSKIFNTINLVNIFNLKIMVKDNAKAEFKYNYVNLNLKVVKSSFDVYMNQWFTNRVDQTKNFYFHVDLECLIQVGQLNIGNIYLKLTNRRNLNIKLGELYEKIFNLTMSADGSLSLSLNENFLNNKKDLNRLNYLETNFMFSSTQSQSKDIRIFIQFKSNQQVDFDQQNYHFYFNENLNSKLVAKLTSKCDELSQAALIGSGEKFKVIGKNNFVELWTTQKLDAEIEQYFEFSVIAKCKQNDDYYLMWTNVTVHVNDLNDNYPIFVNPPLSGYTFHKILSYSEIKQDQDILLTYFQAYDSDISSLGVKYSLNRTSLRISSMCQQLFKLRLNLNKINGELSVSNLYTESSFRHCQFYYEIEISASDSVNVRNLLFFIKIDLFGPDLVFYKQIEYEDDTSYYKIEFDSINFFQIEKCWVNGQDADDLMSYFLSENNVYFYAKNSSLDVKKFECELSSDLIKSKHLIPWLMIEYKESNNFSHLPSQYLDVTRQSIMSADNFILNLKNLSQSEPNDVLEIFSLSDMTDETWRQIFSLSSFSGDLKTKSELENYLEAVQIVDLITLVVEIKTFKIGFKNRLMNTQLFKVYLNVLEKQYTSRIEQLVQEHNSKFINISINYINQTSNLKLINFGEKNLNTHNQQLEVSISSVMETYLYETNQINEISADLFKIIETENKLYLAYNSLLVKQNEIFTNFRLYSLALNICTKEIYYLNSFSQDCSLIRVNFKILFDLNPSCLVFSSNSLRKTVIKIEDLFYGQNLQIMSPNIPFIDLKSRVPGSSLVNWESNSKIKFKFLPNLSIPSFLILNEQDGTLFIKDFDLLPSNFTCEVMMSNLDKILSNLTISLDKMEIKTNLAKNITLKEKSNNLWHSVLNLGLRNINQETFTNIDFVKRCENLEEFLCDRIFKMEKFDGSLAMNQTLAFSHRIEREKIYLELSFLGHKIAIYNIFLNFFYTHVFNSIPLVDSDLVNFINSSEVKHKIFVLNRKKLGPNVYMDMERVKNLNSNSLVLALDYRIQVDNSENYYLEIPFAFAIEPNQLYSFDFVARYRNNGSVVGSFLKQSIYLIRLGSPVLFTAPKKYFNTMGEKKFKIDLKEFQNNEEKRYELWHTKFIINHISTSDTNFIAHSSLDSSYLHLNLDSRNVGPIINLKLNKFVIDKLSLEIIKVFEYHVLIETFDWEIRKPSVHELIKSYSINFKVLKSEIINNSSNKNQYDFFICKIGSNFSSRNLIEYSLVYNENLPFEIGKYTGELYYLPSEDKKYFNKFYEKDYIFQINAIDLNGKLGQIVVQFRIFDDDPICYFGYKLNQIIEVSGGRIERQIIGKIDLKNAFQKNKHKNFSELLDTMSLWKIDYKLKNLDNNFSIDSKTGLIFANNFIEKKNQNFYQLTVEISSKFRQKTISIQMFVYVVFEYKKNSMIENFEFERKNLRFTSTNSNYKFKLNTKKSMENNVNRRFRLINQNDLNCQVNSLTGIVYCQNSGLKKINFYVVVFNSKNVNNIDLAKVEVKFLNKLSSKDPATEPKDTFDLEFSLEYLPKIGDLIVNVFDLIKDKHDVSTYHDQYRLFLISNNSNSQNIQFYFNLNEVNGDLILKKSLLNYKTCISQYVKLVSKSLDYFKIFKLSVRIKLERLSGCLTSLTYSDLIKSKSNFVQIGSVYQSSDHSVKYFLENSKLIKSISNNSNLVLSEKVEFGPINSLIFVDLLNGALSLNRTMLVEKKIIKFDFFVSSIKSNENLKNIQNRYMCRFGLNFEKNLGDILKFLGINKIDLDLNIDANQVSIGDTIFNVRDLISSSEELFNSSFKIVSDFKVPFKINEKNGEILLNSDTWFKSQAISVSILVDSFFKLEIRFFAQSIPRSIDQDVCHRNSTFSRINNHLNVRKSIYRLKIGLDDFNKKRPILRIQTTDFEKDVMFMFVNNQQGLPKFFTSLLKLNELNGELSTKIDEYKNFMEFCTYYSAIQVNTLINVRAYNAKNSNIFGHVVIQIDPDCGLNFINSRFSQPFYFIKVSSRAKIGNLLTKVSINLTSYEIKYTLCNNNDSLVRMDEATGDVYLNQKLEQKRYQIDICALIVNKMISKPIKVETKLIILVQDYSKKQIVGVDFKSQNIFSFDFYTKEKNNLKTNLIYFEKNKDLKLVSSSPGLFSINSSSGWLNVNYLSKHLSSSKLHHLKVFHSDLEIFDFKIKFKETIMDLFISRSSKIGSLILNLKKKFPNSYQSIVLSNEYENFFNYDPTNGLVYLARYPANLENQFVYYAKFGSVESHFYILKLRIKFLNFLFTTSIEPGLSIYKNVRQDRHYFFNYEMKMFDHKFGIVGRIYEKSSIESQKCVTDNRLVTELFSLSEFGRVYINNSRIIGLDCDLFEINARSFTDKNVTVTIQVQIENFLELKYSNIASTFDENYSTILVTDLLHRDSYSINIYDLVKFKQKLNRIFDKQFVMLSDTKLIKNFSFDSNDGLLSLNFSSNFLNGTHLIEFQLVLKKEIFIKILNLQVFVLNGFVSGNEYFFNSGFTELELVGDEEISLIKLLKSPISNKKMKILRHSGIRLLMKNHEPFIFDPLSGSIRVAEKIQQNFSRLAEFSACIFDQCQRTKLKLNYRPNRIEWFDKIKKYYQNFKPKIEVDLNFKNLNPFLFKLKTFGNSLDYFKVNTNNVVIEPGTGLVFLNNQRDNIEKFYFLILNNSSVLAEYSVSFIGVKQKLENAQVEIEVFQRERTNLNPIYIGNLEQTPLECQNWDGKQIFKIDNECNMYLIGNFSSQSMFDNTVRAHDPMNQFKSKFLNIRIILRNLKNYYRKYLIEFKYVKKCDEKTKAELYKFLRSKFSFDLLDIENFEETKSLVFLISSSNNFQNLKKYHKYMENKFSIVKSSVYAENFPYKIIESDSNDHENLIEDTNLILSVQKAYEIFSSQDLKFKNSIQFEKFSYQHKKNLNFSIQNFIKFKIWFKIDRDQLEQFLFSSKFQDSLITCEVVKNGIRIFHNLDESDKTIVLENQIHFSQWYQLDIQLDNNVFFGLKKWETSSNVFNLIDTYEITNSAVKSFFINDLYLGGLPVSSPSFSYVDTYYSDKLSFSRFQVNSINVLEPIVQNDIYIGDKNFFKISQNYKNFLDTEQFLFEKKSTKTNEFTKGFNLTIKFQILNNTGSIYKLIKSHKSQIVLDLDRKKVEFYILNNLISSIDLRTLKTMNKFELYVKPGLVKLDLNGLLRETSCSYNNLNFDLFKSDLFLSEYVSYQNILINSKNIKNFYFNSNKKINGDSAPKLSINVPNYQNSDASYKPSLILIIILCFLVLASLAVLSILMFILVQKRKVRTNINFSNSKFNSRNPLEISVNSSTQNSPISSNSDFTTSLETQINPNRETQQNYFEYDTALAKSSSIPFFNSFLATQATKSSNVDNSMFSQSDLEQVKSFLNWSADIYQFSSLLNELEKFSNHNHACSINLTNNLFNSINYNSGSTMNNENVLGSLNLYEEYDKQTFV